MQRLAKPQQKERNSPHHHTSDRIEKRGMNFFAYEITPKSGIPMLQKNIPYQRNNRVELPLQGGGELVVVSQITGI
jgi:hypothetical protein